MVSSRNRSSTVVKLNKPPLDEWTTREKLCLASLAIKYNNAWNSVARNMQSLVEKGRPEGWSNQKTCAAQFNNLMNELGVDKRPKRNEPSDGNSGSVIYKKMAEKRIKELEDNIIELRKLWMNAKNDLDALESCLQSSDGSNQIKQQAASPADHEESKPTPSKPAIGASEGDKPPTRAQTRRESSRQNLEKLFAGLHKTALEIKGINSLCKPTQDSELELYEQVILKHVDMSTIKKKYSGDIEDPYAVMNDLLLMFQNATMFYPPDHPTYKIAVELREKLVPQWEKTLVDRFKVRH